MNFAEISVKRPILIICIMIAMLTMGIFFFKQMPVDMFPEANIPTVSIQTVYAGAQAPMKLKRLCQSLLKKL